MARAGLDESPQVRPPDGLKRVLAFVRLNGPALATVRRVVEGDEAFRARVAAATAEAEVGEAAWLWLRRPDGWAERVEELLADAAAAADDRTAQQEVTRLRKALAAAEEAVQRSERAASAARGGEAQAAEELTSERSARRAAEEALTRACADVARLTEGRSEAWRAAELAQRERAAAGQDLAVARAALLEAEHELVSLRAGASPASDGGPVVAAGSAGGPGTQPPLDVDDLHRRVADAAAAASALSAALTGASAMFAAAAGTEALSTGVTPIRSPEDHQRPPASNRTSAAARERRPSVRHRARQPAPLPPGVWNDAPQAAAHLVRLTRAVVLVDGYNVARTAWSALTPEAERQRLLAVLEELHARSGAEIIAVFDGVEEGTRPAGRTTSGVRVRFTAEGVTADDVLRDLIPAFPVDRPVIVVSSDREVADGARAQGANTVSSRQFLSACRSGSGAH